MGGAPQGLALGLYGFFAVIIAAFIAHMVWALEFAAIGAFTVTGARQGMVRAAHIALGWAGFSFRYRHGSSFNVFGNGAWADAKLAP